MKGNQILYVVLAVTIILLIAIAYDSRHSATEEGFVNKRNGCPTSYAPSTVIYGKQSTKICCYGNVKNGKCEGPGDPKDKECILGKSKGGILACNEFRKHINDTYGKYFCPKSMPNLYFSESNSGCTDGPLNASEDGPLHPSSKQCTMSLTNREDWSTNPNSCMLQMQLESLECIGSKCNKFIRASPNNTNMIGMDFVSPDGLLLTCYNNYADGLRANGMDYSKSSSVSNAHPMACDVAKKLYVDKSIGTANIKLLP
jgi:hypothetical protein